MFPFLSQHSPCWSQLCQDLASSHPSFAIMVSIQFWVKLMQRERKSPACPHAMSLELPGFGASTKCRDQECSACPAPSAAMASAFQPDYRETPCRASGPSPFGCRRASILQVWSEAVLGLSKGEAWIWGRGCPQVLGGPALWCTEPRAGFQIGTHSRSTSRRAWFSCMVERGCRSIVNLHLSTGTHSGQVTVVFGRLPESTRKWPSGWAQCWRWLFQVQAPSSTAWLLLIAPILFRDSFTFHAERKSPACCLAQGFPRKSQAPGRSGMLICFIGWHCFVQQGLGLRFVIKSQPALIVHTGKCVPVCAPLISSFQNAEFLLIIVH